MYTCTFIHVKLVKSLFTHSQILNFIKSITVRYTKGISLIPALKIKILLVPVK